jgi:hypothetical protein
MSYHKGVRDDGCRSIDSIDDSVETMLWYLALFGAALVTLE